MLEQLSLQPATLLLLLPSSSSSLPLTFLDIQTLGRIPACQRFVAMENLFRLRPVQVAASPKSRYFSLLLCFFALKNGSCSDRYVLTFRLVPECSLPDMCHTLLFLKKRQHLFRIFTVHIRSSLEQKHELPLKEFLIFYLTVCLCVFITFRFAAVFFFSFDLLIYSISL